MNILLSMPKYRHTMKYLALLRLSNDLLLFAAHTTNNNFHRRGTKVIGIYFDV